MEGLDDTGGLLADAATHRRQTQALPCAPNGTDASNSAVNDTCVHQQCDSVLAPDTMAHWFDSPHSGHEPGLDATDMSASYCAAVQPARLNTRSAEAGNLASLAAGRRGRATSSPPQFGHCPRSTPLAHGSQNVHSKEQMRASADSGGRSRLQHSQFGRSRSIADLCLCCLTFDMSGGPKGAKRPLERPLDGGVRRHHAGTTRVPVTRAPAPPPEASARLPDT